MNFVRQYLKIINYALIGLTFGFASFYLLLNAYHYLELRKDFIADVNNIPLVTSLDTKLDNVRKNIAGYDANTYHGNISTTHMTKISQNLQSCLNNFNNKDYTELKTKKRISIVDVYNLRESYENNVLNDCVINSLYWIVNDDTINSEYFKNNQEIIKLYVGTLLDETSYLKKDLLNNSSYFYNTSIATMSMKNNTKDGLYEVLNSYSEAANLVEFISNWFNSEMKSEVLSND